MSATRESTPALVPGVTPSALVRVVDVVVDPRAAFRAIAERPTWATALLILIAIRFGSLFLFYHPETTPGKLVAGVFFQFAMIAPMLVVSATALWVSCRVWSIKLPWSVAFAIGVHVLLAYTFANIAFASIAGALLPASADIDLREPPFVNLSTLVDSTVSPSLSRGLGEVDIRSAYAVALVVMGIRAALPTVRWSRVAAATATCVAARVVAVVCATISR